VFRTPRYGRPLFYCCSIDLSFFSPPNLQGRLADRHQTLPRIRWWHRFIKFSQKFGWTPEIWRPKNMKVLARFWTTSRLDREYLRNATRCRQSENSVANYGHFRRGVLIQRTLVHKRRKIGPEFWPTQRAAIRLGIATHLIQHVVTRSARSVALPLLAVPVLTTDFARRSFLCYAPVLWNSLTTNVLLCNGESGSKRHLFFKDISYQYLFLSRLIDSLSLSGASVASRMSLDNFVYYHYDDCYYKRDGSLKKGTAKTFFK